MAGLRFLLVNQVETDDSGGYNGAFAALSTIVGTAIGFMGLTYLPPGLLTQTVVDCLVRMPFVQASILARRTTAGQSLETLTDSELNPLREVGDYCGYSLDPFVDQTSSTR